MPFKITKKNALEKSEYEIEGEIHADTLKNFRAEAIKSMSEGVKIDGFRPGHIPEKVIVDKFGEMAITEEAGRFALEKHYLDIIQDAKINPLGSPKITVTKVAPGEAFGFKITTALMPSVELADYSSVAKKISAEKVEVEVTDKEVEEAVEELRKQVAHSDFHAKEEHDHTEEFASGEDNHKGHDHGDLPLPEVNKEFVDKFGAFESVEEFKTKIKENMLAEKGRREKDKKRIKIMDVIIEKTKIEMPKMLIDSELSKMVSELSSNIAQMGLQIDTYLTHVGKNLEDLKKEWLPEAEKRAKTQLILTNIAIKEKINVPEDEVKKEVDALMKYYKDADPLRANAYIETILLNEKVWQFLEKAN